jgi:hypothetical protein
MVQAQLFNLRCTLTANKGRFVEFQSVTELATYTVETLWEDEEFVLSRRVSDDEQVSLLVSTHASAQPTVETVAPLDHAYALRDELDSAWAARPVALERQDGRSALLMEDPGGEVLARMVGKPWDLTPFLHVAIKITHRSV